MASEREVRMIDIHKPEQEVEVLISPGLEGDTLWVNVDGLCRLRIVGISGGILFIKDERVFR